MRGEKKTRKRNTVATSKEERVNKRKRRSKINKRNGKQ